MNKLQVTITAGFVYEAFTVGMLAECPLPRDQVCVTSPKDCREEQHTELDRAANVSSSAAGIALISTAGPNGKAAVTLPSVQVAAQGEIRSPDGTLRR